MIIRTLLLLAGLSVFTFAVPPGQPTERIAIDQFGYLPGMRKVAVISDPQVGFNSDLAYLPGARLEVRRWMTNELVLIGAPAAWKDGATHDQSGDKVWWFDFTPLSCDGEYYIYDPANDARSFVFKISRDVYREVLKTAVRMFYYQRCGTEKAVPFTDAKWSDLACHLSDKRTRLISAQGSVATEKDLSGGWHDAGDNNKYVTFTTGTLQNLLFAYRNNAALFADDYGLPESGNGVPDMLDEIKWELDWLLRMQQADGSVLSKQSVTQFQGASPVSADMSLRYYGPASTSATLSGAMSFANAAIAFKTYLPDYAARLREAALKAWQWAEANPNVVYPNTGFQSANAEVDDYTRNMYRLAAAVHLYALTSDAKYRGYVEANYNNAHLMQWTYWFGFEGWIQDALLYFTSLPGVNETVSVAIKRSKQSSINGANFFGAVLNQTDAYRAYMQTQDYTWGSNQIKGITGLLFTAHIRHAVDPGRDMLYRATAAGYLHYLHGVNPLTMVQLTNMAGFGAEKSANEMYHGWMGDLTDWDNALTSPRGPAPGYVMGGMNPTFQPDTAYRGPLLAPPVNQPAQKSYKDWNTSWPENSWQISEPAIYYQAAYINLLADVISEYLKHSERNVFACREPVRRTVTRSLQ